MSSQKRASQFFAAFGSLKCNGAGMHEHVAILAAKVAPAEHAGIGVVDVTRITFAAADTCY